MTDESIFAEALAIGSPADRAAYLDRACAGNPALRAEVDALLAAHAAPNPLDQPPADVARTGAYVPAIAVPGDRVGPYKLLELIGEGGMGEVWVAEQTEPIKRRVALKLIKPGMDSRTVLARFEAERQALALMDHPNIAKVLDAGQTADGRPYFVMELVKGVPITAFCDARKLTPKERLELFVPVCQAIQHAHMKGIIHRDIKPSNVLVALHDEVPVPKVIDFGVAKAVGVQLTDKTVYTGFGTLLGTPAYMAPEQATFNQLDVDTRADVYALGVLLYELLAGSPPLEKERLKRAALDEVLRIVREEEPPRPSQRLSTAETRASIAAVRGTEPDKLSALMKGELDWIVMKALEKDRTRRYESANSFAADVQRYLCGEQVQAVPPSLGYRLKKAYRRNRIAVLGGGAFALTLLTGVCVSLAFAIRADAARRGEIDQRNLAEGRRLTAIEERDKAREANAALARATDGQRRTRYAAEMNLLQAAYTAGDMTRFRFLLDEQKPKPGEPDVRGFEWHYWNRKLNGQTSEVRFPMTGRAEVVPSHTNFDRGTLSADGKRVVSFSCRVAPENLNPQGWPKLGAPYSHVVYRIRDTATGRTLHEYARPCLPGDMSLREIRLHRNGDRLLVISRASEPLFPIRPFDTPRQPKSTVESWLWDTTTNSVRELGLEDGDWHFSEDLEMVAVVTRKPPGNQLLRVVRTSDSKELMRVASDGIWGEVSFGPDNSNVVAGVRLRDEQTKASDNRVLRCWRIGDTKPLWELPYPEVSPSSNRHPNTGTYPDKLHFTPDGRELIALVWSRALIGDTALYRHDAKTGAVIGRFGLTSCTRILDVNADWVAVQLTNTRFGLVPLQQKWAPDGKERVAIQPIPEYETELGLRGGFTFSPDGRHMTGMSEAVDDPLLNTLYRSSRGVVRTWEVQGDQVEQPDPLASSPVSLDKSLMLIQPVSSRQLDKPILRFRWPRVYHRDGTLVAELASIDPTQISATGQGDSGLSGDGRVAFNATGPRQKTMPKPEWMGPRTTQIEVFDIRTKTVTQTIRPDTGRRFEQMALNSDGTRLAVLAHERDYLALDKLRAFREASGDPTAYPPSRSILVYDVASGKVLVRVPPSDQVGEFVGFDAETSQVWSYHLRDRVHNVSGSHRWDASTGQSLGFVPDGRTDGFSERSRDGMVQVKWSNNPADGYRLYHGRDIGPNTQPTTVIRYEIHHTCRLSPDGQRLLTYAHPLGQRLDGSPLETPPKLWDTRTGRELLTFGTTPRGALSDTEVYPYSNLIWSEDSTRIWVGIRADGQLVGFDARPVPEPKKP